MIQCLDNSPPPSPQTQSLPEIISVCDAEDRLIWLGALLGYKALLLVIGLIFAFESRNVKVWNLKGAKRTGGSIYGIVLLCLALVTAALILEEDVNVRYSVLGFLVLGGCIMLLCIIFIPQVRTYITVWSQNLDTPPSLVWSG